jgi:hypothetical protein
VEERPFRAALIVQNFSGFSPCGRFPCADFLSPDKGMSNAPVNPMDSSPAETFSASRWTQGNFFFPTRLIVSPQRVSRVKSRLFGSNEESIAMSKIASVHISTGVFWSEIVIESTGGTDPITSHGHRKRDAQRIRDLIETYQAQSRS